jgi:hypothetical protein
MTVGTSRYNEGVERSDPSGVSGRSFGFRLPIAGFRQWSGQADLYQELLRQLWSPGCFLTEYTSFSGFIPGAHSSRTTQLLLRNSELCRIGHHICRTWIRWTSLSAALCRPKSRWLLTLIWLPYFRLLSIAAELDWLVTEYICKTCHSFRQCC